MPTVVSDAVAGAGVTVTAKLEVRQPRLSGPTVQRADAGSGSKECAFAVQLAFSPDARVSDVVPAGLGTGITALQSFVDAALRNTPLHGGQGTARDLVSAVLGDMDFPAVQQLEEPPQPPGQLPLSTDLLGVTAPATPSGLWKGGTVHIACASWEAAQALRQMLTGAQSDSRVRCKVQWKTEEEPSVAAGFLVCRLGERSSLEFIQVESGSVCDRKIALALHTIDPLAMDQLRGDERMAIVAAGLKDAQRGLQANCSRCQVPCGNATAFGGVSLCEACTVQTILMACWAPDLEQVAPDASFLTELVDRGRCQASGCAGGASPEQACIAYINKLDTVPKCFGCWWSAMQAVQHAYKPELSEHMDGPMLRSLFGRAYAAMSSVPVAGPAFGSAQ